MNSNREKDSGKQAAEQNEKAKFVASEGEKLQNSRPRRKGIRLVTREKPTLNCSLWEYSLVYTSKQPPCILRNFHHYIQAYLALPKITKTQSLIRLIQPLNIRYPLPVDHSCSGRSGLQMYSEGAKSRARPIKCGNPTLPPQQQREISKERGVIIGYQKCFYEVFSEKYLSCRE